MDNKQLLFRLSLAGMLLALLVLSAACAGGEVSAEVKSEKERLSSTASTQDVDALVQGNSEFAAELYQQLAGGDGNIFFSPYSISAALAMTYGGARGITEEEMEQVLHFALEQEGTHSAFNHLDAALMAQAADEGFTLNIANAIWGQQDYKFLDQFLDRLAENYGAGLRVLDFISDPEGSRQTINQWVEEMTEERIKDLIPAGTITPDVRMVLTNAIYFLGKWTIPFDANNTHDGDFVLNDGSTVQVPMMSNTATFQYYQGDGFQAARMDYRDSDMSMVFLLPDEGGLEELEQALSADVLEEVSASFQPQLIKLKVPKFSYESEFALGPTLMQMGMQSAFSNADFSGMTGNNDLFISDVIHKAFVAVDEEGTEAAAATAVVMKMTAIEMPDIVFTLDHPFLYFIQDNASGTILFAGRMMDPS